MTVVCQKADAKSLIYISRETREMTERARNVKVKPADIDGSTFAISNLGMFEWMNLRQLSTHPKL